jgi:NAD(P)-dependent dehydrogenase (short-subunit alcohol dehydrogenase family)
VAVVTGAGSPDGIGFAAARMLAELGAAVMITAPTARIEDRASELCSAGFDAAGFTADLTRPGPPATGPDSVINPRSTMPARTLRGMRARLHERLRCIKMQADWPLTVAG